MVYYKTLTVAAVLLACVARTLPADDHRDKDNSLPVGAIAYQYVGRVDLGKGIVYAYISQISGVPQSALFKGTTASEATALFSIRADITGAPLPPNGELATGGPAVIPFVVAPGDFKVYFDANPARQWGDPNTFTTGKVIATFSRIIDQQNIMGAIANNAATAELKSSTPVALPMRMFDLGRLVPEGVTNVTTGPSTPLAGTTSVFAFSGYGLAIGSNDRGR